MFKNFFMPNMQAFSAAAILILACFLFNACDKDVSTTPPEPPAPTALISLESNPPGALIYLNGKITGKVTPDSLPWLKEGTYKITLKLPLFRDTVFFASALEGKKLKFSVDYFANPLMYGSLACTSDPDKAAIYINEQFTGQYTPYTFRNLKPGSYLVKLKAQGCRDDSMVVTIESNKTVSVVKILADTTTWLDYNRSNSPLPTNYLSCIETGSNDVKWIGTAGSGLVIIDGNNNWYNYNTSNSQIPGQSITCLATDYFSYSGRGVWVGTSSGLAYYNGSWKVYTTENSKMPDDYITSISVDRNNIVWVGTMKGLVKIQNNVMKIFNTSNSSIPANWVTQIASDFNGNMWVGTLGGGIAFLDLKENWTIYNKSNSNLPGNTPSTLSPGQSLGGLWAGFAQLPKEGDPGGLAIFENSSWKTDNRNLPSFNFESIVLNNNIRWICTDKGIVRCPSADSKTILDRNNSKLPSDHIKDVAFDSKGHMWIATANAGLVLYKVKQ